MVDTLTRYAPAAGRVLLALIYLHSGVNKVLGWGGTAAHMAAKGMPLVPLFLLAAIVAEVGGAASVILGYKARWGALALIVFTIAATLIFHDFWALEGIDRRINLIMFMKNLSMIGGLLLVAAYGAGPFSIDSRKQGP